MSQKYSGQVDINFDDFDGFDDDESDDSYSDYSNEDDDYSYEDESGDESSSYVEDQNLSPLHDDLNGFSSDYTSYSDSDYERGSDSYDDKYYKQSNNTFQNITRRRESSNLRVLRSLFSTTQKLDKRSTTSVLAICTIFVAVVNLAKTGYMLPATQNTAISVMNKAGNFPNQIIMRDYNDAIFTPGSDLQLQQIEAFEGDALSFFEHGEILTSKQRDDMRAAARQEKPPLIGTSMFEYGEFYGIAITPEQYWMANRVQQDLNNRFWAWIKESTPTDYYALSKERKKKQLEREFEEAGGQASLILGLTENGVPIPSLAGFKDVWEPMEATDTPVFFHIPKAGGTTIKNVIGTCHRMTMASEVGVMNGHDKDTEIGVVRPFANPAEGKEGSPFMNVDTTTTSGIERAKKLGLAQSGKAECIVSPLLYDIETVFSPSHKGRIFTIFRHPLERAISMFYYIQVADWEPTFNPILESMTLQEYATSAFVENNWMVRRLSNVDKTVKLTEDHLEVAMDIVRRKFLVGLLDRKEESMDRFETFFGWKFKVKPDNQEQCRTSLLEQGANKNIHDELPEEETDAHNALLFHNKWDLLLYTYIEDLFHQQGDFVVNGIEDFRLADATCAKCVPPTFPLEFAIFG